MRPVKAVSVLTAFVAATITFTNSMAMVTSRDNPVEITDPQYMYPSFGNGEIMPGKKNGRLPAMGWNSWNAFGRSNNERLTREMADKIVELRLDELGYEYIVIDDGSYEARGEDGKVISNKTNFPSGFKAISDYVHSKGLKFGMYNDICVALCSG